MTRKPPRKSASVFPISGRSVRAAVERAQEASGGSRELQALTIFAEAFRSDNLETRYRLLAAALEISPEESAAQQPLAAAIRHIADEFVYEAWACFDREEFLEGITLARRALEIWPECAEAWLYLAENMRLNNKDKIEHLERALEAGEKAIGVHSHESAEGFLYVDEEVVQESSEATAYTPPALRARLTLALALRDAGENERAYDHLYKLFDVDPSDRLDARFDLIRLHLLDGDWEDAAELLALYKDDASLEWRYNSALAIFIRNGNRGSAEEALQSAISFNPYVAEYLLGLSDAPRYSPPIFQENDEYGAVNYLHLYSKIWEKAPGALNWLRTHYSGAVH